MLLERFLFAVVIRTLVTWRYACTAVMVLDRVLVPVVIVGFVAEVAFLVYLLLTGEQGPF
jgi:hypothetical protein